MSITENYLGLANTKHYCVLLNLIVFTDAKICRFCRTQLK